MGLMMSAMWNFCGTFFVPNRKPSPAFVVYVVLYNAIFIIWDIVVLALGPCSESTLNWVIGGLVSGFINIALGFYVHLRFTHRVRLERHSKDTGKETTWKLLVLDWGNLVFIASIIWLIVWMIIATDRRDGATEDDLCGSLLGKQTAAYVFYLLIGFSLIWLTLLTECCMTPQWKQLHYAMDMQRREEEGEPLDTTRVADAMPQHSCPTTSTGKVPKGGPPGQQEPVTSSPAADRYRLGQQEISVADQDNDESPATHQKKAGYFVLGDVDESDIITADDGILSNEDEGDAVEPLALEEDHREQLPPRTSSVEHLANIHLNGDDPHREASALRISAVAPDLASNPSLTAVPQHSLRRSTGSEPPRYYPHDYAIPEMVSTDSPRLPGTTSSNSTPRSARSRGTVGSSGGNLVLTPVSQGARGSSVYSRHFGGGEYQGGSETPPPGHNGTASTAVNSSELAAGNEQGRPGQLLTLPPTPPPMPLSSGTPNSTPTSSLQEDGQPAREHKEKKRHKHKKKKDITKSPSSSPPPATPE